MIDMAVSRFLKCADGFGWGDVPKNDLNLSKLQLKKQKAEADISQMSPFYEII